MICKSQFNIRSDKLGSNLVPISVDSFQVVEEFVYRFLNVGVCRLGPTGHRSASDVTDQL
jgi:hypothetical protein